MLTTGLDVSNWTPNKVHSWLTGLCDDDTWLSENGIIDNRICGRELLLMTSSDLEKSGVKKVYLQECLMSSIEKLKAYNFNMSNETLQKLVLRLGCLARSLHKQLALERESSKISQPNNNNSKNVVLLSGFKENSIESNQRVSLDTLVSISNLVTTVKHITDAMSHSCFSKHNDLRSMRSLILALSIELTSTAQRDQFVEKPNDIIERSAKALADYCDRLVQGVTDPLLIQPFHFETVKFKKDSDDLGFVIKSLPIDNVHIIDKVVSPPLANKTNRLNRGDEVIQINDQTVIGWTSSRVEQLINQLELNSDVILMVKKLPRDSNL